MIELNEKVDDLRQQLTNLRQLFADAAPTNPGVIENYAWTILKVLLHNGDIVSPKDSRQLLADCIRLPYQRPSRLHSVLLSAAVKVADLTTDLHFSRFLSAWDLNNLREDDYIRQKNLKDLNHPFPSLVDRVIKRYAHDRLMRMDEQLPDAQSAIILPEMERRGYKPVMQMIVTRTKQVETKENRKLTFVTLASADGVEVECVSNQLQPNPLHSDANAKRHYVNIGQMYDVQTKTSRSRDGVGETLAVVEAFLSAKRPDEVFEEEIGYIESIDLHHGHMHVYDRYSRHFVAPVLRFSKEKAGDFVRFIPVVPQKSRFKTAIITRKTNAPQPSSDGLVRTIRITFVNHDKHYASWELVDDSTPITERLSPLQLSQGESSPSFTSGYLSLDADNNIPVSLMGNAPQPVLNAQEFYALIYLHRGKDGQKRPRVARVGVKKTSE